MDWSLIFLFIIIICNNLGLYGQFEEWVYGGKFMEEVGV